MVLPITTRDKISRKVGFTRESKQGSDGSVYISDTTVLMQSDLSRVSIVLV
jgi:hypothetical protein